MDSLRYRSEHYLRNLVPFLTTIALLLLSLIPVSYTHLTLPTSDLV